MVGLCILAAWTLILETQSLTSRWEIDPAGGICTTLARLTRNRAHSDHLEMGGKSVNAIVSWKVDAAGVVTVDRLVRWPTLRTKKDDTHSSLSVHFESANDSPLQIDGRAYKSGPATTFRINGMLEWTEIGPDVSVKRTVFPSVGSPCLIERWHVTNTSQKPINVDVPVQPSEILLPKEQFAWAAHRTRSEWIGAGRHRLMPGESIVTGMSFSAREDGQPAVFPDVDAEWSARSSFFASLQSSLSLKSGDPVVDQLFEFSKLRAAENVLATRGGLMHAPGGFNKYLAALWCNDQNEYVSPFFPYLGNDAGNESARNAYAWFAKYMNPEYKHLPSSIVAEGRGTWQGAGDRGDAAMTAYGAARWALATGDPAMGREVWPLIEWCLEYCERQKTPEGVIASDSDELEGRFSSGKTNLATSCLTYDALISAAYLAEALDQPGKTDGVYRERAKKLREAINRVFGTDDGMFKTYRYHEGLEKLRSWICIPLVMDIHDRANDTVKKLLSKELWTENGLLTEVGTSTYWDRSTLYALRGVYRANFPDLASTYLRNYAESRLLGDHVPYCQEAYPEQNQSHLSAESGLYCRILTEGAFGIRPTGFDSFRLKPQLPQSIAKMSLKNIRAFGRSWDCLVRRDRKNLEVRILTGGKECYRRSLPPGSEHEIRLP
ncbi:MAG: hypothetical protein ABL949_01790 [Fimbriimonadaceae bacterium]